MVTETKNSFESKPNFELELELIDAQGLIKEKLKMDKHEPNDFKNYISMLVDYIRILTRIDNRPLKPLKK